MNTYNPKQLSIYLSFNLQLLLKLTPGMIEFQNINLCVDIFYDKLSKRNNI